MLGPGALVSWPVPTLQLGEGSVPGAAVTSAIERLASRAMRTEADVQADIYLLLTSGELQLATGDVARLEQQVGDGTRRRLDVEVGRCVIEVKKDLRPPGIRLEAERQLAGYVGTQSERLGVRYVGVLTDGTTWRLYHRVGDRLEFAAELMLNERGPDASGLMMWLEAILATQDRVPPIPVEIDRRLGADSPAHLLDHATLMALLRGGTSPEVQLKRDLWAKLLRTAFGTAFVNDEELFVDHTLLVLTAEVIAHAVVGFDISPAGRLTARDLASGSRFADAQIYGVVESDFFDWVLEVPGGPELVLDLARRVGRFDWSQVDHDVLKTLYESVISAPVRASLGEYYTPDWLAERMVVGAVPAPLDTRVLDPACGSGTFVFHAARAYLSAADAAGLSPGAAVTGLAQHVFGMDVHPVAVTLARVTYLLAIGRERLAADDREALTVPVYLGDALQWEQRRDLSTGADVISVSTSGEDLVEGAGGGVLFGSDLVFPRSVLHDAGEFDRLVSAMADRALTRLGERSRRTSADLVAPVLRRFDLTALEVSVLEQTFHTMRQLHLSGRNHIWGYYVRNLIRPLWLAEHPVHVLVGNPPWLRYSKMTAAMQDRYRVLAQERGLLSGPLGASGRDLATLFVVRAVELYLASTGRFSFVMPHGTLTRRPHAGFRSGSWRLDAGGRLNVSFSRAWDLTDVTTGFPMHACVVHGNRGTTTRPLSGVVDAWVGRLSVANVRWEDAAGAITVSSATVEVLDAATQVSPYKKRFRQGAVLAPRALLFVELRSAGPLGAGAGRVAVASRRTSLEKPPWKSVPSLHGMVERRFVRDVHLGETVVPYRMLEPLHVVLPLSETVILTHAQIEDHAALAAWWAEAEKVWERHKSRNDPGSLLDRVDFHGQLSAQLKADTLHRVVYTKAGNTLAAARLESAEAVIDHKLYWTSVQSVEEARFLVAVLNSQALLDKVRPLQAVGLFGPRDFDKNVFAVPIPTYDPDDSNHRRLVELAARAEQVAATIDLPAEITFQSRRQLLRRALESDGTAEEIETAVTIVIDAEVEELVVASS